MPIVREPDAVQHRLHGSTSIPSPRRPPAAASSAPGGSRCRPGTEGVAHRVSREEVFLLLGGRLSVTLDGVTASCDPGDVLVVPAGSELVRRQPVRRAGDGLGDHERGPAGHDGRRVVDQSTVGAADAAMVAAAPRPRRTVPRRGWRSGRRDV